MYNAWADLLMKANEIKNHHFPPAPRNQLCVCACVHVCMSKGRDMLQGNPPIIR